MSYRTPRRAWRARFNVFVTLAGTAAALAGCGGDSSTGPGEGPDPQVSRIEVSPGADTLLALGDATQLDATALDASGRPIPGIAFTWTTTDAGIATVTDEGLAEAVANGEVEIVAMAEGVSGSAALAVIQQVSAVTVLPAAATLTTTAAIQAFTASATDANGNEVDGAVFVWQSENHAVATVDPGGTATSRGSGTATITATAQDVPGHAILTVDQTVAGLAFVTEPGDAVAGEALDPAVRVEVVDAAGHRVTGTEVAVTVGLGAGPSGGTLSGTRTVNATDGVATFPGLWIDRAGTGYALEATVGSATPASSATFDVTPGAAASLAFTADPADAEAGLSLGPVAVEVRDAFGNTVPGATQTVGVSLAANPGGGTLGGTVVGAASASVATFPDLWVDRAATGYTLRATSAGLTDAVSGSFTIGAGPAAQLGFRVQPSTTRAALNMMPAVEVEVRDRFGNAAGTGTVEVRVETTPNRFGGTLYSDSESKVLASGGVAVFDPLIMHNPGTYQLAAYASGLEQGVSRSFDIVTRFDRVSAGGVGTCVATDNPGDATGADLPYCWGADLPHEGVWSTPQFIEGAGNSTGIAAGDFHACSFSGRFIFCWGAGSRGQLGNGSNPVHAAEPTFSELAAEAVEIDAGSRHTCARTVGGDLYCWGDDQYGQLGDGTPGSGPNPSPLLVTDPAGGPVTWASVSTGGDHTCAVTDAGAAYCWGAGAYGQLGNGGTSPSAVPVPVDAPAGGAVLWQAISAGAFHTCGVTDGGSLYCWGSNGAGTLGVGSPDTEVTVPTLVLDPPSGPVTWATVSSGGNHTCALTTAGAAYCWGVSWSGQLGLGDPAGYQTMPAPVADPATGPVTWLDVDAGNSHTCGITDTTVTYCWGSNSEGQVGDGTSGVGNNRSIPTRVVH